MARKAKRTFSVEFQRNAVELLLTSNKPLEQVARELDVSAGSLFTWRQKFGPTTGSRKSEPLSDPERHELETLRKRVGQLEEDREILKKAAAFFVKESTR